MTKLGTVAVLDVGKSNIKLSACTCAGEIVETLSTPNPILPGPPWKHHDLRAVNIWVLDSLGSLAQRHPLEHFITSGHGSGAVLVGEYPDAGGDGLVLPMVDYEQDLPDGLNEVYTGQAGSFFDRGSALMMSATHIARQMFWAERDHPAEFACARWLLGLPQYWAWRLSGVAVSEVTILGAQSHLWNVPKKRWAPIVTSRGWQRLMPPMMPAWSDLGAVRPDLAQRHALPAGLRIHVGVHDSSANYYCYQSAGMTDVCLLSTGTWIVAMADRVELFRLDEAQGMTCNADVAGAPLCGALTMGGREYAAVAGEQPKSMRADPAVLAGLIGRGTMALPTFGSNDGQFLGSAGKGHIVGPPPETAGERHALAVLYTALLAVACADTLEPVQAEWIHSAPENRRKNEGQEPVQAEWIHSAPENRRKNEEQEPVQAEWIHSAPENSRKNEGQEPEGKLDPVHCAQDPRRRLVLDGSFLRDPAFAALVAALRPEREVLINREGYGIATGAARLCAHTAPPLPLNLTAAEHLPGLPDITAYASRWHNLAKGQTR